jgi:SARP family transcriptional regulator, regulator of embCAB operon
MLSLYRSGMRATALAAYLEAHDALRNASGIDPGPSMRFLHQQILHDAPSLLHP